MAHWLRMAVLRDPPQGRRSARAEWQHLPAGHLGIAPLTIHHPLTVGQSGLLGGGSTEPTSKHSLEPNCLPTLSSTTARTRAALTSLRATALICDCLPAPRAGKGEPWGESRLFQDNPHVALPGHSGPANPFLPTDHRQRTGRGAIYLCLVF